MKKEVYGSELVDIPNTVVLEKVGIFYYAYGDDACVLSYIMNYVYKKGKCGFPIASLERVISLFSKVKVNIYVDGMLFEYGDNYNMYLDLFKSKYSYEKLVNEIVSKVKFLIANDGNNYYKIKELLSILDE